MSTLELRLSSGAHCSVGAGRPIFSSDGEVAEFSLEECSWQFEVECGRRPFLK